MKIGTILLEKSNLPHHAYEEGHRLGWDKARILTAGIGNKGIGAYDVLNQSDQPTQIGHISHLNPPYQQ
jgi:hypothetical protein